jgi:hypothetical protein
MLYIIMNLTQLEWIKMELKQRFYEKNEIGGPSKQESRDTTNSAREKNKLQG